MISLERLLQNARDRNVSPMSIMFIERMLTGTLVGEKATRGRNNRETYLPTGFPQGANISPFLSIMQLTHEPAPLFAKILMYADDGLFYSDKPFSPRKVAEHFREMGLCIAPEKSG